jgi:hypothetical protein
MQHQAYSEPDRVRANTSSKTNNEIDQTIRHSIEEYAGKGRAAISKRISDLDHEWDVERTLELNASTIALTGLILGATVNRKWLFVPGVVLPFLFQHAVQGWCPPLPVLRKIGIRTREEIDLEKYALKALRGDFENASDVDRALHAAEV